MQEIPISRNNAKIKLTRNNTLIQLTDHNTRHTNQKKQYTNKTNSEQYKKYQSGRTKQK